MTEKLKTMLILFFILALAAGLAAGPGLPAYAQAPEETDEDEIIDCSIDPDSCEEAEVLDYGYTPPVLPPAEWPGSGLMIPDRGFLSFRKSAEDIPPFYRSDREPWAEGIRVKNQDPAGTCWAFSVTTAAEYSYAKQTYDTNSPVTELSPGHLAYFMYNRVDDPLHNTAGDQFIDEKMKKNWPDAGGNEVDAALHLSTWSGFASEKDAPYQIVRDGFSPDAEGKQHWDPDHEAYDDAIAYKDSLTLRSFEYVRWMLPGELNLLPEGVTKEEYRDDRILLIKKFLLDYGAVSTSLHMEGKKFAKDFDPANRNFRHFFADVWYPANHEVTIIDWDDSFPMGEFAHDSNNKNKPGIVAPKIDGAWIVQNSWGGEWGDNGIFYVSYDSKDISWLSDLGVFTLQDPGTYQYNFQYDGSTQVSYPGEKDGYLPDKKTKAANIFVNTTGVPVTVDAVGFSELEEEPADYTIRVYTGLSNPDDPESGTLAASAQAHTDRSGFMTVDLDKKAFTAPGERFSVVFSFEQTTNLCIEKNLPEEDEPSYHLQIERGQSFYQKTGGDWQDMADAGLGACWRIKAFANPAEKPGRPDFFPITCEDCRLPETGFSSGRTAALSIRPRELETSSLGMTLQIPRFDVAAELTRLPRAGNSWPVEWLGDAAGVLEGSALPGEGYSVIAAHNTLDSDTYGPFALLVALEENDKIIVSSTEENMMVFSVYANELVGPEGFAAIASAAEEEPGFLILLTCENESAEGGYLNRRAVFARPM